MAVIAAPFHGLQTDFYVAASAVSLSAPGTPIGEVGSLGTLDLSANIIEFNAYGNDYKQKLVGQKDSGSIECTLNWVPDVTEAGQALLKSYYDSGAKAYFGIIWSDAEGGTAGCTFEGYIASYAIDTPAEDVVTANVTIAIDGAVTFDVDGTF